MVITRHQLLAYRIVPLAQHAVRGMADSAVREFGSIKAAAKALGWRPKQVQFYLDLEPILDLGGPAMLKLRLRDVQGRSSARLEQDLRADLARAAAASLPGFQQREIADYIAYDDHNVRRALLEV